MYVCNKINLKNQSPVWKTKARFGLPIQCLAWKQIRSNLPASCMELDGEELDSMMGLVAQQTTGWLNNSNQLVAAIRDSDRHVTRVSQSVVGREQVASISTVIHHQRYTVPVTVTHRNDARVTNHTQTMWADWRSWGLGVAVTIWNSELTLKLSSLVKYLHISATTSAS